MRDYRKPNKYIIWIYLCTCGFSFFSPCLHTYFVHHTFVIVMLIYFVILYFYFPICRCCMHEWEHNFFFCVYVCMLLVGSHIADMKDIFHPHLKKKQQQLNTTMKCWLGRKILFAAQEFLRVRKKKESKFSVFYFNELGWCVTEKFWIFYG